MEMNEKQALSVIEEMINNAKSEIKDNGFLFMFWGWLVFIAAISNYYLLEYTSYEFHSIPWLILMPLGGVVSAVIGAKKRATSKVKTYVSDSMKYMVQAFAISMFIACFTMPLGEQWRAFYPTIMVLYSIWLYVSGGMLKFKPLMWGGALNWAMAAVGYIFPSTPLHLLLMAVAVFGGYIIPGYLLKRRFDRHVQGA